MSSSDQADRTPFEDRLAKHRRYLQFLARTQLRDRLSAKVDPSDIVQDTFTQAVRKADQFKGTTDAELAAWLRQILARNLLMTYRHYDADRRAISRERQVVQSVDQSSQRLEGWLVSKQHSPSSHAMQNERALALAEILESLPETQRTAVVMHYWQGMTIREVASTMDKSPEAVGGLLYRALKRLRSVISDE